MAGEGGYLRRAREMHNLTLADVEEITKIRRTYLQALENEAYEELPGDAYIRGFLRNYARLLSLDPDEIIDMYTESVSPEEALPEITPIPIHKTKTLSLPLVILVVAVVAVTGVLGVLMYQRMNDTSPNLTYDNGNFKAPLVQQNVPKQDGSDSSTVISGTPLTVHITILDYCWLRVKADGETVVESNIHGGESRTITANEKIEIDSVGRPRNITINFNGKDIDITPYITKDGTAANLVLTADS